MIGFIVGTLCLVALIATVRRHSYARYGYYGPCARGYGYGPPWREYGPRHGPRSLLRELFVRLDTTPGQEKAIVALLEHARDKAYQSKRALYETRKQVAALLGSDVLDKNALTTLLEQPQVELGRLSHELADTLSAVHELLDDRQRRALGELIADGSLGYGRHVC